MFFKALRRLRASNQVEEDIEEMRAEERAQQSESSTSMMELICSPTLRAPLVIGIVMQLSQQLSGINAVNDQNDFKARDSFNISSVSGILLFNFFVYEFWFN
jgi:Sugar (and other) transporter